jgi:hypothetical protein
LTEQNAPLNPTGYFAAMVFVGFMPATEPLYIDEEELTKISMLDGGTAIQQRIASNQRMLVILAG